MIVESTRISSLLIDLIALLIFSTIKSHLQNVASPEGDAGLSTWYEVVLEGIIVELCTHKDLQRQQL